MHKSEKNFNWKAIIWLGAVVLLFVASVLITLGVLNQWNGTGFSFYIKEVLLNNFLGITPMLIGILVLVGYLILGRSFLDSFLGMLRAMIGVLILTIGAGTLVGIAKPIFIAISKLGSGNESIVPLDPYFGWTAGLSWLGSDVFSGGILVSGVSFVLLFAFIINLILVMLRRWTNTHSLMVTGHVMFQQATMVLVMIVALFMFSGINMIQASNQFGAIVLSSVILGVYWAVGSSSTIKGSDVVTQKAGFCVGHQQMFGVAIAYGIGRFFGKKEQSAEQLKMHPKFKIFEDNIFTQILLLLGLFLILIVIIQLTNGSFVTYDAKNHVYLVSKSFGPWTAAGGGVFWILNIFFTVLKLVGGILVLQMGVRMFVSELQQSFQGIGEKLVPGATVAVDIAATFGFSPNSVTYGFFSGTIAQFIAFGIMLGLSIGLKDSTYKIAVGIPLFITLFFNAGALGVFANASGGYKAALIVPAIMGFLGVVAISLGLSSFQYLFSQHVSDTFALNKEATLNALNNFQWTDASTVAKGFSNNASYSDLQIKMGDATYTLQQFKQYAINNVKSGSITTTQDLTKFIGTLNKALNKSIVLYNAGLDDKVAPLATLSFPIHTLGFSFQTGYIGMFDWNFVFGGALFISGWNGVFGLIILSSMVISMLVLGQIIDTNRQEKATFLQRMLHIKPQLITE